MDTLVPMLSAISNVAHNWKFILLELKHFVTDQKQIIVLARFLDLYKVVLESTAHTYISQSHQ
jgi:hypothetical protein